MSKEKVFGFFRGVLSDALVAAIMAVASVLIEALLGFVTGRAGYNGGEVGEGRFE